MANSNFTTYLSASDPAYTAIKNGWNSKTLTNIDFNNITSQGIYFCHTNVNHAPDSRVDGIWRVVVLVFGGAPQQFALKNGTTTLYTRAYSNNTWSSWATIGG